MVIFDLRFTFRIWLKTQIYFLFEADNPALYSTFVPLSIAIFFISLRHKKGFPFQSGLNRKS